MTGWMRAQLALGLTIVLLTGVMAGCSSGEPSKGGQPVLEGDYTTEPGQTGKPKG